MKGQEIEREDPSIEKAIVKQELGLCEMMLGKDERNFHVWNYRNWIINTFKIEDPKLVDVELKFIDSKLETNFSNFSALHFKSKNLISKYGVFLDGFSQKKVE
jgi:geranylgeranyl transferase type-2 subunit alpha